MNTLSILTVTMPDQKTLNLTWPEPCRQINIGGGGDIPLPGCPGLVRLTAGDGDIMVHCQGQLTVAGEEETFTPQPGQAYTCASGGVSFSFALTPLDNQNAPTFDRAIELTGGKVLFGGSDDCHVQFDQPLEPCVAFEVSTDGSAARLTARRPMLGVYANTRRLVEGETVALSSGDFIFTCGGVFTWQNGQMLTEHTVDVYDLPYTDTAEQNSHLNYPMMNRTSRFYETIPTEAIEIAPPARLTEERRRNILISLLPSLIMLVLIVMVQGRMNGSSMAVFSVCSMGVGMAGSVLAYFETRRNDRQKVEQRETDYRAYIDRQKDLIRTQRCREKEILQQIYLQPDSEIKAVLDFTSDLFDRSNEDQDFLDICCGTGPVEASQKIKIQSASGIEEPDELAELRSRLAREYRYIQDAPVVIHGAQANAIGVQGDIVSMKLMLNQILIDLTTRQYPEDVELYLLCGNDFETQDSAARFLPHLQDHAGGRRNIAHDIESRDVLLERIYKEFAAREEEKEHLKDAPWMVIFLYTGSDVMQHPVMRYIPQAAQYKALFIVLSQYRELFPMGCTYTLRLFSNVKSGLLVNMSDRRADCMFSYRGVTNEELCTVAEKLAPVYSKEANLSSTLVRSLSFYDIPGIDGKMKPSDILANWAAADTRKSLAAPLGVAEGGVPVTLDLAETAHGPHGLVAGTTGSGKSELLISYILSMAYTFSPDDVNFVIIDFKGGGTASQFASLPHLVGTITNLSDNEMSRSLVSIHAESRRRQQMFNQAGVSNINAYTTEYRAGRAREPLPHLIIVADEFAELKSQQPDFMNELISQSRIGRSLGIHLILATQKPGGVVNDQIWSNSDFKLCLRVQTRGDSNDVLHSPLAAEIKEPGRAYLQVGRAELFQLFQSGYSGVSVDQAAKARKPYRLDRRSLSGKRTALYEFKPTVTEKKERTRTQFDQALSSIITAFEQLGGRKPHMLDNLAPAQPATEHLPHKLWLNPLQEQIDIDSLPEATGGPASIVYNCGMLDDPSVQAQFPMTLDLTTCGNLLIVGDQGCGKTTFLQTMLYVLSGKYGPERLNYYALDYSGRLLRQFAKLPHCGAVLTEDDDNKLDSLFDLINGIIQERKAAFERLEVTTFETACLLEPMSLVLVIIDNLAGMGNGNRSRYHRDILHEYIKAGTSYGIHYIVTISHMNEISMRVKQEMSGRIAIRLDDRYDYSDLLGARVTYVPATNPGRGMFVQGDAPLEMQLAMYAAHESATERIAFMRTKVGEMQSCYLGRPTARRMKTISASETYDAFCAGFGTGRVPLGYSLETGAAVALPLKQFTALTVYFGNPDSVEPVLDNLIYAGAREEQARVIFMIRASSSCFEELPHKSTARTMQATPDNVEVIMNTMLYTLQERHKKFTEYCAEQGMDPMSDQSIAKSQDYIKSQFYPVFVIFERYADIVDATNTVEGLVSGYSSVYLLAKRYRIYIIGCVYPGDGAVLTGAPVYECFNPDKLVMLFGGNLNQQRIVDVPYGMGKADKPDAYNQCLMHYRGEMHAMLMPCGAPKEKILPEDDRPIF